MEKSETSPFDLKTSTVKSENIILLNDGGMYEESGYSGRHIGF